MMVSQQHQLVQKVTCCLAVCKNFTYGQSLPSRAARGSKTELVPDAACSTLFWQPMRVHNVCLRAIRCLHQPNKVHPVLAGTGSAVCNAIMAAGWPLFVLSPPHAPSTVFGLMSLYSASFCLISSKAAAVALCSRSSTSLLISSCMGPSMASRVRAATFWTTLPALPCSLVDTCNKADSTQQHTYACEVQDTRFLCDKC